jgi:hypothetical protein
MKTIKMSKLFYLFFCIGLLLVLILSTIFVRSLTSATLQSKADGTLLQFTSGNYVLGFGSKGIYAATGSHTLHVEFVGAGNIQPETEAPQTSVIVKASPLSHVRYSNLWPGINLIYDAPLGSILRSTYQLEAGADANAIRLKYNVPLIVNSDGSLRISFETGTLNESAPLAWQVINGKQVPVVVHFIQQGNQLGFALGEYDALYPLTIDPSLTWSTFIGGGDFYNYGSSIAVDSNGYTYVTGDDNIAWGTPVRPYANGYDVFVTKLNANGELVWHTFLGSSGDDYSGGIVVDGDGNVYVSGSSNATWGTAPLQDYNGGSSDVFIAKLDVNGGLQWNTFIGGSGYDNRSSIALDGSNNLYITGRSNAAWGTPVLGYVDSFDVFVVKISNNGVLQWSTFLGGNGQQDGKAIATDGSGNVYVAGDNSGYSWGAPVQGPIYGWDAFATKLDSATGALQWNTFLGGNGVDNSTDIIVDDNGNVYLSGESDATWGTPARSYGDGYDGFAAKLNSSGALQWNTFLGSDAWDVSNAIALNNDSDYLYVVGGSYETWGMPINNYHTWIDGFTAKIDSIDGVLKWNAFTGGSGWDQIDDAQVDADGNIFIVGTSNNAWGTPVHTSTNNDDTFVVKLSPLSDNANLSDLVLSTGALDQSFLPGTLGYGQWVGNTVTSTTLTPTSFWAATVTVNGNIVASGNASDPISLAVGQNTITVVVTAENGTTTKTYTVTVTRAADTTAPTVDAFNAAHLSNSLSIPITTFTTADNVGVTGYLITGSSTVPIAGDSGWSETVPSTYNVSTDDTYTLYPWAKDAAGNISAVLNSPEIVVVDTVAPDISINSSPNHPTNHTDAKFSFSSTDGTATFTCKRDNESFSTCTSPRSYSNLNSGVHIFWVKATDTAGNISTVANYYWAIRESFERVQNGGFNTYLGASKIPAGWTAFGFSPIDGKFTAAKKEGLASVKVVGQTGVTKTLTQMLPLSGNAGDLLTFSFWAKGASVPSTGICGVQLLLYSGATLKVSKTISCTTVTTVFQKKTLTFNATSSFTNVVIKFTYAKASGAVWFDAVSLTK